MYVLERPIVVQCAASNDLVRAFPWTKTVHPKVPMRNGSVAIAADEQTSQAVVNSCSAFRAGCFATMS